MYPFLDQKRHCAACSAVISPARSFAPIASGASFQIEPRIGAGIRQNAPREMTVASKT